MPTYNRLSCFVCGYPISWHFEHGESGGKTVTCTELLMSHGPRTRTSLMMYLQKSAELKRQRGMKRLAKLDAKLKKSTKKKIS